MSVEQIFQISYLCLIPHSPSIAGKSGEAGLRMRHHRGPQGAREVPVSDDQATKTTPVTPFKYGGPTAPDQRRRLYQVFARI